MIITSGRGAGLFQVDHFSYKVEEREKVGHSEYVPCGSCRVTWSQSASRGDWNECEKWFRELCIGAQGRKELTFGKYQTLIIIIYNLCSSPRDHVLHSHKQNDKLFLCMYILILSVSEDRRDDKEFSTSMITNIFRLPSSPYV